MDINLHPTIMMKQVLAKLNPRTIKLTGCLLIEYWVSVALKDELPTTNVGLTKYL